MRCDVPVASLTNNITEIICKERYGSEREKGGKRANTREFVEKDEE